MAHSSLLVEVRDGAAWLSINRPEKLNSITVDVLTELRIELERFESDSNVFSIVLTGVGDKAFCTGIDLSNMAAGSSVFDSPEASFGLGELFSYMWIYPKPIVAMVHGYALAGGFGLAVACDIVVCSDEAVFGTPEINVGLWPFIISVPLLRYVPPRILLELMMTGSRISAARALSLGIVNEVVSIQELEDAVLARLNILNSKSGAVLAIGKRSFYQSTDMAATEAFTFLAAQLHSVTQLEDFSEGRLAFASKRKPVWKNR